jgi:hypothetical protein
MSSTILIIIVVAVIVLLLLAVYFSMRRSRAQRSERAHEQRHRASPVLADDKLYLTARDGVVTVVKPGRNFEILATNDLGEGISASPAVAGGRIYLRTNDALYAIEAGK